VESLAENLLRLGEFAESLEMSSVKGLKWMDFVTVTYGNPINYRFGGILLPTKASEPIILWRFYHWREKVKIIGLRIPLRSISGIWDFTSLPCNICNLPGILGSMDTLSAEDHPTLT